MRNRDIGGRLLKRVRPNVAQARNQAVKNHRHWPNRPETLCECRGPMLESVDQVLGMEFQLLQAYFFELLIRRQIRLLKQFFQPLSVATMFGVETTYFFAQRGVIYLVHQSTSLFS
jgi:hypothetical protein